VIALLERYAEPRGKRMNQRNLALAFLVSLAFVPVGNSQTPNSKFADCLVTVPRRTPDSLLNNLGTREAYWNGNLYAAAFWSDATVMAGPRGVGFVLPDGSMAIKYPWFRAAGLTGKLTVTGRRLDAAAPPLNAEIPSGYGTTGFQATGLIFPTDGCWEITGKVGDTILTFVNRVIRAE
jgi:hypothetical protein